MACLRSELPFLRCKYFSHQVDRSSEEPDGEADRNNHYAEGGSGTKGTSPGKQNAGSESPKPGRRRHSRRSSQDFEMMMRAESSGPGGGHVCPSSLFRCKHPFFPLYRFHMCPHVRGHRAA